MDAQSFSGDRVSAVIVHYKTPEDTLTAARAVAETAPAAEIVVVDNASGDGVADELARRLPGARLIRESVNRGYGAGCNRGARGSSRPFLLFLNSDARVLPGAIEALERALEDDPAAAAAGPRLLDAEARPQASIRLLPTPWRIFCESSGLAFLAGGREPFGGHTQTRQDHRPGLRVAVAVEALMGAALLVRRADFEAAGGFDESFFLYAEETDLMRRLRDAGRRILFVPDAEVVHVGGRSGGDRLFGQLHASLVRYVRKHHGGAEAGLAALLLDAGAAGRYAAALLTPGERGRARRLRYRSALQRRSAR
ncbi:MAG TPA: glycosyltransferase family 2 protein [Thermoanaerobaculia bacterium]